MRRLAHSAVLLALVALFTVGGMVVVASPASADTGGSFDPSNYALAGDPLVTAAAANASTAVKTFYMDGQLAGILMNKIRYAKAWTVITKRLGFGAKQIEADATAAKQLPQLERAFAPIASKLAPVIKTVGGVAEIAMAAQLGISAGAGVDRAIGVDVSGGLCAGSTGVFSVVNTILAMGGAADCEQWRMHAELAAHLNQDASGTWSSKACDASGANCATLTGKTFDFAGKTDYCVTLDPAGLSGGRGNTFSGAQALYSGTTDLGSAGRLDNGDYQWDTANICGGWFMRPGNATAVPVDHWVPVFAGVNMADTVSTTVKDDPFRTLRCDVVYTDGTTNSASTASWHEGSGAAPPYVCPGVPDGKTIDHGTIWETGGPSGDIHWADVPVTPEYQADSQAHPDCQLGQCRMDLVRVSDGLLCLDNGATCDGWFTDPTKTTDYKCQLGAYPLPLDHCNAYAPTFNQQKVAQGSPYADPTTGAETGQTTTRPTVDSNQSLDPQTGSCFPTGWGVFNPVEWIQKPVTCALQAAFVPSPATITNLQTTVTTAWKSSTPGQLQSEVESSIPEFKSTDSGCDGILINFPTWNATGNYATTPEHVLAACPGDYFAQWAPLFSTFIGGAFLIGGILGIKRLVSAMVGMHDMGVAG